MPTLGSCLKDSMGQCMWPFMFHTWHPQMLFPTQDPTWCCLGQIHLQIWLVWSGECWNFGRFKHHQAGGTNLSVPQDPPHSLWLQTLFSLLPVQSCEHWRSHPASACSPLSIPTQPGFFLFYLFIWLPWVLAVTCRIFTASRGIFRHGPQAS